MFILFLFLWQICFNFGKMLSYRYTFTRSSGKKHVTISSPDRTHNTQPCTSQFLLDHMWNQFLRSVKFTSFLDPCFLMLSSYGNHSFHLYLMVKNKPPYIFFFNLINPISFDNCFDRLNFCFMGYFQLPSACLCNMGREHPILLFSVTQSSCFYVISIMLFYYL